MANRLNLPLDQVEEWTDKLVCARLKKALQKEPSKRTPDDAAVISWPSSYPVYTMADGGVDLQAKRWFEAWMRCLMERTSFSELCKNMGWKEWTVNRRRMKTCRTIAAALNEQIRRRRAA
jgi:hypothetical protein